MLALEGAMAVVVATYYLWPAGSLFLSRFAGWQQSGGVLAAAAATALAGGLLSETCVVYFQHRGRWTLDHVENAVFKLILFFISGAIVYEFYGQQAVWFGHKNTLPVVLPKVLVDQFIFSVFWAVPYQALMTRWQTLRYSGHRLWRELDRNFLLKRLFPILVTNWLFWIPGVSLIYSMPTILQVPLFIFATAMWGILLAAVSRQADAHSSGTVQDLVPLESKIPY